jgi:hypothetical protein
MTTLTKIIVTTLLSMLFLSCNFEANFGSVNGTGNVVSDERNISEEFTAIKTSRGLDVFLTQGDDTILIVEADENLHDIIKTEVENGTLIITASENIGRADSKKVRLTFKNISKIKTTSGSDVYSTNTLNIDDLEISSTSGSDVDLSVNTENLICKSTSGSQISLRGKTNSLNAKATSGSNIKAEDLIASSSHVSATSGAGITVNSNKELYAKASSGGDITYYGNPNKITKSDGVSGNISKH